MVKHPTSGFSIMVSGWKLAGLLPLLALGACAATPSSTAVTLPPGIPVQAVSYSIAPPADDASRAAAPFVDAQLRRLGYRASDTPDLIVVVSATGRGRNVGAMAEEPCRAGWVEAPDKKWLIGGGRTLGLQVQLIDAKTQHPVYRSSAQLRTSSGSVTANASRLAAAALGVDPRQAPPCGTAR
jgi:hypothetical protein